MRLHSMSVGVAMTVAALALAPSAIADGPSLGTCGPVLDDFSRANGTESSA